MQAKEEFLPSQLKLLIPISLQPDGVDLFYFKIRLFDLTKFIVLNINFYDFGL